MESKELKVNSIDLLNSIVNSTSSIIVVFDLSKCEFVYSNDNLQNYLGYTINEINQLGVQIIHPDDSQRFVDDFKEILLLKANDSFDFEYTILAKKIEYQSYSIRVSVLKRDSKNFPVQILGEARQISSQSIEIKTSNETNEIYNKLFQSMADAFALHQIEFDKDGVPINYRYVNVNPAFEKLTRVKKESIIGKTVSEVLPYTERYWIENFDKVALTGESIVFENYSLEFGKWFRVSAYSPKKGQFAIILNDITERRSLEENLAVKNEDYVMLSEVSLQLMKAVTFDQVFDIIEKTVPTILPDSLVLILSSSSKENYLKIRNIIGLENSLILKVTKLIGWDPRKIDIEITETFKDIYSESTLYKHSSDLAELAVNQLPKKVSKIVEKVLDINEIYTIGIASSSFNFGNLHIFTNKNTPTINRSVVESFVHQCYITFERIQIQNRLSESDFNFRKLAESINAMFWIWDQDARKVLYVNPVFEKIWGYKTDEFYSNPKILSELIKPEDLSKVKTSQKKLHAKGENFEEEFRISHPDGSTKWIKSRAYKVFDNFSKTQRIVGLAEDITEYKQLIESLYINQKKFSDLFESMLDGYALHEIICDENNQPVDYRFIMINPAFERMTKFKADDIIGKTVLEVMPGTEKHWIESYGDVALTGKSLVFDNFSSELGKWFRVSAYSPKPYQFAVVFSDITESKKVEETLFNNERKLKEQNEEYLAINEELNESSRKIQEVNEELLAEKQRVEESERLLIESQKVARVGHYVFDIVDGFWESSEILNEIYGIDQTYKRSVEGWLQIIHPEHREMMLNYLSNDILKEGKKFDKEYKILRLDNGKTKWVHGMGNIEFDSKGNPIKIFGIIQDITERKEVQEILFDSEKKLKEQNEEYLAINEELTESNERIQQINRELIRAKEISILNESKLKSIFRAAPAGIGVIINRTFIQVNEMVCQMTGYSMKELVGETTLKLYCSQEEYEHVGNEKYKQISEKGTGTVETRWKCKDGTVIDILLNSSPIAPLNIEKGVTFTAIDITARKKAEYELQVKSNELKELNDRFEFILGATKTGVDIIDEDYNLTYVDNRWKQIYGEYKDRKCYEYFMDRDKPCKSCGIKKAFATNTITITEEILVKENNRNIEVHTIPFKSIDGKEYVAEFNIDITERKKAELESKVLYDIVDVANSIPSLDEFLKSIHYNISKVMYAENCYIALLDNDMVTLTFPLFVDQKDPIPAPRVKGKGLTEYVIRKSKPFLLTPKMLSDLKNNSEIEIVGTSPAFWLGVPLLIQSKPIGVLVVQSYDHNKKYSENDKDLLVVIGNNVAMAIERKRAEEALKASVSLLDASIESTADGILIINNKGEIEKWNQKFAIMWQLNDDILSKRNDNEIINHILSQLLNPKQFVDKIHFLYSEPEKSSFDQITFLDGRIYERYSQPQKIGNEIVGRVWSFRDATERLKTEELIRNNAIRLNEQNIELTENYEQIQVINEELQYAKERAEESDTLKSAFLANISHEIRTPMNGIVGFSEMLIRDDLSREKQVQFANIIIDSSNQLLSIISDVLDISIIESGKVVVKEEPVNVNDLFLDLLTFYSNVAERNNLSLYSKKDLSDDRATTITDKTKLKQILSSLIGNAIKFTHEGYVEFGYKFSNSMFEFFVKDTGIGIDPSMHSLIFERFRQVDNTLNRGYGGTGLGLSISKVLIEKLGGRIWLESEIGKGTTLFFTLPYNPVKCENDISDICIVNDDESKGVVLVAEDVEVNYYYLEELLLDWGFKVLHAKDGLEAVEMCRNHNEIELVLMDIKMPKMDGYGAFAEIKKFSPDLPIIAQTAYAMSTEKEQIMSSGFDGYISKPINKDELFAAMGMMRKKR